MKRFHFEFFSHNGSAPTAAVSPPKKNLPIFAAALTLPLLLALSPISSRAAAAPDPSPQADTPDIVNGKWQGTVHATNANGQTATIKITKHACAGAPCKKPLDWARDDKGNPLICIDDTPSQGESSATDASSKAKGGSNAR